MKIKISRKDIEEARVRMILVLSHMQHIEPDIGLNYFTTLNILNELLTAGEVKFADDDCVYTTMKEKEDAGGEEQTSGDISGSISGTDTEDKGSEDRQEEMASGGVD